MAVVALGLITTAVPATASVSSTGDNSSASVWGPQEGWLPLMHPDYPCPVGAICLYTEPEGGYHFVLPHCTTYKLYNWNGWGHWYSRQTGGVAGQILDSSRRNIGWIPANQDGDYNFNPAYYVVPC